MKLALFDIDGVLADERHRQEFALAKQWPRYFSHPLVAADTVWEEGRTVLEVVQASGWTIGYLTGRREDLRPVTQRWLRLNGFPFGRVIMKPMHRKMNLAEFKVGIFGELQKMRGIEEIMLFDDDPDVIRKIQAAYGNSAGQFCDWHKKPAEMVKVAVA